MIDSETEELRVFSFLLLKWVCEEEGQLKHYESEEGRFVH